MTLQPGARLGPYEILSCLLSMFSMKERGSGVQVLPF